MGISGSPVVLAFLDIVVHLGEKLKSCVQYMSACVSVLV